MTMSKMQVMVERWWIISVFILATVQFVSPADKPVSRLSKDNVGGPQYHPNDILAAQAKPDKPVFLKHPQDGYIIKSRPAVLNCSVIYSNKAYFTCNGEALAKSIKHTEQDSVDVDTGAVIRLLSVEISREQVEEYFGVFKCGCDAWSAQGQVSSQSATVSIGFLNKEFEVPPYSQSVVLNKQVELRCHPPKGNPKPRIYWMKNKMEIQTERETNFMQSADGHLIIIQVGKEDVGNYTCVAENLVNRRFSATATVRIFVDGSWSPWSPWSDCDVPCGRGNQRRYRMCNSPAPSLNGDYCFGDGEETTTCVKICKGNGIGVTIVDGSWSSWSGWSTCSPDCMNYKMRTCTAPVPSNGGKYCSGRDQISASCSGGMCREVLLRDSPHPPQTKDGESVIREDLSLVVGLSVALLVFLSVTIVSVNFIRRKGRSQSIYNMASLVYREEYQDKDSGGGGGGGAKREETNFSFPGARVFHKSEDKQILKLDFPGSSTNSPYVDKRVRPAEPRGSQVHMEIRAPHMESKGTLVSHLESKGSLVGPPLTNQKPNIVLQSPDASEHQYDVPFSHLSKPIQPTQTSGYSDIGDLRDRFDSGSEEGGGERTWVLEGPGLTPLIKHSPWSASERSLNSSLTSDNSLPASSIQRNSVSSSVLPPGIDPDSFTISTVSHTGCKLSLAEWGVSLLIPEGALDPGYTEEVFLAVMREGRDQPALAPHQTVLSPVVLAGPPRLSFKKPVVISFHHCASLQHGGWEVGVYHCDSLFSDARDSAWVKLVTVSRESLTCPIYTHLDFNTCHILTDFLSRFCLVGQSEENTSAVKVLKVVLFGKYLPAQLEYLLLVSVVEDTQAAIETAVRHQTKAGFKMVDKPKSLYYHDPGRKSPEDRKQDGSRPEDTIGSEITLTLGEIGPGWSTKSKRGTQAGNKEMKIKYSWSRDESSQYIFTLVHSDPSSSVLSLDLSLRQTRKPEYAVDVRLRCDINKLTSPISRSSNCSSLVASSSGCSSLPPNYQAFKLAPKVRQRLCSTFDQSQEWRNLALGLRLDRFLEFYTTRKSPTDCILSLWEAQQNDQGALTDLLNIVRLVGRQEVASDIEKEVGSWV